MKKLELKARKSESLSNCGECPLYKLCFTDFWGLGKQIVKVCANKFVEGYKKGYNARKRERPKSSSDFKRGYDHLIASAKAKLCENVKKYGEMVMYVNLDGENTLKCLYPDPVSGKVLALVLEARQTDLYGGNTWDFNNVVYCVTMFNFSWTLTALKEVEKIISNMEK